MKEILLTQGKTALVDDDLYEELNRFKWHVRDNGKTFYAERNSPSVNGKRHRIHMHHEIIGKPLKGFEIDHRNGQGTDNRSKNLRFVTRRQNLQNLQNIKKTSKHPGVYWNKNRNKWQSQIEINGKCKYLGLFTNEKVAHEAYKQAVKNLGEKMLGEK